MAILRSLSEFRSLGGWKKIEEAERDQGRRARQAEREQAKQARDRYQGLTKAELSDKPAERELPKTGFVSFGARSALSAV